MDNPRFAFFFDEIPFWRLVSILILIMLLFSAAMILLVPQLNVLWGGWRRIPADMHSSTSADYRPYKGDNLPPLKSELLQEIQNMP
jgi:hypothetical protein